jgi:membrane-associated phospholipid phosphatase
MHVGWTFLLAIAIILAVPHLRWRWLAFVIPLAMFSSTVVTGNHWFVDGALGLVVASVGLFAAIRIRRWTETRGPTILRAPG